MTEQQYIESLLVALDRANEDLFKVKRANSKLKKENRDLRRTLDKIKKGKAETRKSHYKNGKRGSKFNG
jgi:predicted  nucleic acid-binding Zn-ribbon protein